MKTWAENRKIRRRADRLYKMFELSGMPMDRESVKVRMHNKLAFDISEIVIPKIKEIKRKETKLMAKIRIKKSRDKVLASKYNVTLETITAFRNSQTVCQICGKKPERLCLDHCHTTGKLRGMLCNACNSGLGFFKDNQQTLLSAVEYLKKNAVNDKVLVAS
jgi:hypothetical protein